MTLIEKQYQTLAKHVIIQAYKDKAKNWIKNKWNFNLFCGLALMIPEEVEKKFLNMDKVEILEKGRKTKIAHNLGVSYATLDYWHRKYNNLEEAIKHIQSGDHKYNTHSLCDEYYEQIVKMRKENKSWKIIAEELNIGYNTLYGFSKKMNID